ncbi:phosphotransferase [Paenibacillus harenae]|uniref:phosphotransferase n=1 Tax=Paenibacillus harenae TaxID=306543 RepID=UPI00278F7391|nr:phosphotransferase [Paenibacillus harenae]MDQ0060360.1 hypothetical protein [Paenibacillus harenae]
MLDKSILIAETLKLAAQYGLTPCKPLILSDQANLIIHMSPHPLVARYAVALSVQDEKAAHRTVERELNVARHLHDRDVPVLQPSSAVPAGPHKLGGTWMTLWSYATAASLKPIEPSESVERVCELSLAMRDFEGELPLLGVWERACHSAARLRIQTDPRIAALLEAFQRTDQRMRSEALSLLPCHGDAHANNLFPSSEGWIWMDFEDACLMPEYWDMASYVANLALFGGLDEPTFAYMLRHNNVAANPGAFGFAVKARVLMSTLGNLDYALEGYGDLGFATRQLELAGPFIHELGAYFGQK